MTYHNTQNLRLEVEVPTEGLPNLVQNPDGLAGAWGWLTPVNNTVMSTFNVLGTTALRFATHAAQAAYVTTENMPATAGRWYGARYYYGPNEGSNGVRARFEWLNSAGEPLSSSTQDVLRTTAGTYYYPSVQAPAGTAYVRLRFDMYNTSGANPAANTSVLLRQVMVTHAATAADLNNTSRTNRVANAGFNTDLAGWAGTTLSRATDSPQQGTGYLKATSAVILFAQTVMNVTGGKDYTVSGYVRSADFPNIEMAVEWLDVNGNQVAMNRQKATGVTGTAWKRVSGTLTAPTAAVRASLTFTPVSTQTWYTPKSISVDSVLFEEGTTLNPWYEGTHYYGSNYDFAEPRDWKNVLGPSTSLAIEREELDVGSITVHIKDEQLDPAVSPVLRPGKAIRLLALLGSTWTPVYTGAVDEVKTTYPDNSDGTLGVDIEVTAVDNIAALSNQLEARGMATMGQLALILEGRGVPWNVNGSGAQIYGGTVVSYNDNATVLNQVAVTRDSNLGAAWVDRFNCLNVWDASLLAAKPLAATFTDSNVRRGFPSSTTVLGWASHNLSTMEVEESQFGATNGMLSTYVDFVTSPSFPQDFANAAAKRGAKLLISWEPWDWSTAPNVQPSFAPRVITAGEHDSHITAWLKEAQKACSATDVIVRFAPEMNDTSRSWATGIGTEGYAEATPAEYVAMWKHVRAIQQDVAPDVQMMWNPLNFGASGYDFEEFFPGLTEVDVLGLNGFNWSDVQGTAGWQGNDDVFGFNTPTGPISRLKTLAEHKPWGIAETASAPDNPADFQPGGKYHDSWGSWVFDWPENPPYEETPEDWITQAGWARMLIRRSFNSGASFVNFFNTNKETDWRLSEESPGSDVFRDSLAWNAGIATVLDRSGLTNLSYSDIDIDFDLARCINRVNVNWLRYNTGTSTTEEVSYPLTGDAYVNPASVKEWGPRAATFTVQGAVEDAAAIQVFADRILAANANPTVKANSLTMPVRNEQEFRTAVTLDLYSRVRVQVQGKIDHEYLITGLSHDITPDGWTVTYEFAGTGSVAAPMVVPSPPFMGTNYDTGWKDLTLSNGWTNYGAPYAPAQARRVGNQVYLRGLIKAGTVGVAVTNLPAGMHPDYSFFVPVVVNTRTVTTGAASTGTAHTHPVSVTDTAGRLNVNVDGNMSITPAASTGNGYISLDGVTWLVA